MALSVVLIISFCERVSVEVRLETWPPCSVWFTFVNLVAVVSETWMRSLDVFAWIWGWASRCCSQLVCLSKFSHLCILKFGWIRHLGLRIKLHSRALCWTSYVFWISRRGISLTLLLLLFILHMIWEIMKKNGCSSYIQVTFTFGSGIMKGLIIL